MSFLRRTSRCRRVGVPPRTARLLVGVLALLAAACSSSAPVVVSISADDVVLAYVDEGLDADVADCFVGLGQREFDLEVLMPGAAPEADRPLVDEMLSSCIDAVAILGTDEPPERQAFDVGPFNIGDDMYLDALWVACDRGDGEACDVLWEESPVGSMYESFGVSCGNRPQVLDCGTELVPDEPEIDPDSTIE